MEENLGDRLKKLREKNGWSKVQVAGLIGVTPGAYGNWEYGNREPNYQMLKKIADVYKVTTQFLLTGEDAYNPYDFLTARKKWIDSDLKTNEVSIASLDENQNLLQSRFLGSFHDLLDLKKILDYNFSVFVSNENNKTIESYGEKLHYGDKKITEEHIKKIIEIFEEKNTEK